MNQRLFEAIGEADPYLIARSERRRRPWAKYGLAAAACLAMVLAAGRVLPSWTEPAIAPPDEEPPPVTAVPDPPKVRDPRSSGEQLLLPEQGSEIGTLRLLSYVSQSQEQAVDFLIYVNEEQFFIREDNKLYSIRNTDPLPDNFPVCGLDILHLSGTSPAGAKEAAAEALRDRYAAGFSEEESTALPDSLYFRASNGADWNSEQAELWFVDDGQGGTFVLTARYFLEAEEGLGQSFRDMASSFRVVSLNETVPGWMRELYETADRLFPALFTNDLSGVSGLLSEGVEADAYRENVWADISIASVDYKLDSDREPSHATVSVKHRLNRVEGDSFNYLTMELSRKDGIWLLTWSGIEK